MEYRIDDLITLKSILNIIDSLELPDYYNRKYWHWVPRGGSQFLERNDRSGDNPDNERSLSDRRYWYLKGQKHTVAAIKAALEDLM